MGNKFEIRVFYNLYDSGSTIVASINLFKDSGRNFGSVIKHVLSTTLKRIAAYMHFPNKKLFTQFSSQKRCFDSYSKRKIWSQFFWEIVEFYGENVRKYCFPAGNMHTTRIVR